MCLSNMNILKLATIRNGKKNCTVLLFFPNGLGSCPRKFTKLNNVPITTLHFKNILLNGYVDDFFPKGDTFSICEENIHKTMRLYNKLSVAINLKKCQIVSTQRIRILGFVIDSVKMIATLTKEMKQENTNFSFKVAQN